MTQEMGARAWEVVSATPGFVDTLRQKLSLHLPGRDLFLAYCVGAGTRFDGYLVTKAGDINHPLAYCPIHPDIQVASATWYREVDQQLRAAIDAASGATTSSRRSDKVVWLEAIVQQSKKLPAWIYSLACIPITYPWNGTYLYSRPFCPDVFETMSRQPEAVTWILRQSPELQQRNETKHG